MYNPGKVLATCLEGTVVAEIRATTVRGWFVESGQPTIEADGRAGISGVVTTFDYPSHLLGFLPNSSDTLTIGSMKYKITKPLLTGGGVMTKLVLGSGKNV